MGVGGSNTSIDKRVTSSANNADRHWSSHIILAKVYRR